MTLHETAAQLYSLSVGGYFNGEKFSRRELENYLSGMFRPDAGPHKLGDSIAMEIALPDGVWLFLVSRYADRPDAFGYWIPDTRAQEARLWARLTA